MSRFKTELNQKDPPRTVNIKTVGIQGLNQSEMPALHARKARTIIVRCGFYTLGEYRDLCGFRLWTPSAAKKPAACRIALSSIPNCTIAGPDRGNSSQSLGQHTVFPISDNGFKEDSLAACREI
ncbi:hypothetical protein [Microcoleus sp.]|uniref:hypothetical protein n=1 Tax=Microcoleus sp. TaxID=44472 RepID=UPI0035948FC7